MEKSGKWLILAILVIALASGGFSWWFRWSATHRAADFWGPEAAKIIRDAKNVTAARLTGDHPMTIGPKENAIVAQVDASKAKGLLHFKQALLEDRSYNWQFARPASENFEATYRVLFGHPSHSSLPDDLKTNFNSFVVVMFNEDCTRCCFEFHHERSSIADCSPISQGLLKIFSDWLSPASN